MYFVMPLHKACNCFSVKSFSKKFSPLSRIICNCWISEEELFLGIVEIFILKLRESLKLLTYNIIDQTIVH